MSKEMLRRAKHLASVLTDPTTKRDSFYCIVRREAKKYGEKEGVELELRKCTLSVWVEEYLMSIFVQELPLKEEKALTNTLRIVTFIMEHKVPDYLTTYLSTKKESEGTGTYVKFFKEVYGSKVPSRKPKY